MIAPDLQYIKALMLVHLHVHGPQNESKELWASLQEQASIFPDNFPAIVDLCLRELSEDKFISVLGEKIYLRRPLGRTAFPIQINLATTIRMASLQKALAPHPDAPTLDPFEPKEADLEKFAEQAFALAEQVQSDGAKDAQIQALKEEAKTLKAALKKYQDADLKARQAQNKELKQAKLKKASEALSTHKVANGVCTACGLSTDLILDAHIPCDGQIHQPAANT